MRYRTSRDRRDVTRAPTWIVLLTLCASVGCGITDGDEDDPEPVIIEGVVLSQNGGTPINAAVISTSIDGQTATTDATGRFRLETVATGDWCCTPYTLTISASGFQTFSQSHVWGQNPIGQEFFLVPIP